MDYLGVIVGILAVLVTILIGLQLYNYIFAKENIKQIIDEEIRKMGKDFEHVTSAHEKMLGGYDFVVTDYCNEKIVDSIMMALKDLIECENSKMRDSCIDYMAIGAACQWPFFACQVPYSITSTLISVYLVLSFSVVSLMVCEAWHSIL